MQAVAEGIDEGRIVGLVAVSSPDFVARAFATFQQGKGFVTLRSAEDRQRLALCGGTQLIVPQPGHGWIETRLEPRAGTAPAQICFTSGTEGEPKGVVLNHDNLADVVGRINGVMQVNAEIREYVGVPVYHSFGFGRCRAVCTLGGRAFLPPRGFNPIEINSMLEAGEINAISAVPSLWRVLLATGVVSPRAAARVRWIEIGSQAMSVSEKRAMRQLFPGAIIVQHYGLTEASRTTLLEVHSASDAQLGSVGRTHGRVELGFTPDGRIRVRGPHVTSQMLVGGTFIDPRDAEGWLTSNDRGELRDGVLHFLGRADDVINCGGLKLPPDLLEASVREQLGLRADFSICRVPNPIRGDGILLVASADVTRSDAELAEAVVNAAAAFNVSARDATHVWRVPSLPRTDTGKVKRDELARRFSEAHAALAQPPTPAPGAAAGDLRAELCSLLGVRSIADGDTFINLGGDSLRFIQASVSVERRLGYLPDGWERLPMAALEALPAKRPGWSQFEPSVLLRALAITSVILNHTGAIDRYFAIDGAAFLLLLPAGSSFARFQLQRVIDSGRASAALATLPRVILPTLFVLLVQQARHHDYRLSQLLFYNNFVSAPGGFNYWFIEVYVQVHLLLALVLSIPAARYWLQRRPYASSIAAVFTAAFACVTIPLVWNTEHLGNLLPHFALWYFLLGWCTHFSTRTWQRWLNSVFIVCLSLGLLPGTSRGTWIILGGLFLNWAKPVRLPVPLARAVSTLASASLYIYISHWLVLEPFKRALPSLGFVGQVVCAWLVGIAFWLIVERGWMLLRRLRDRATRAEPRLA